MAAAAVGAGLLGVFTFPAVTFNWTWATQELGLAAIFLVLNVMHGGVRLGRKVYLVDMASGENRAAYVAVSNTVIGLLMLVGGLIGLVAGWPVRSIPWRCNNPLCRSWSGRRRTLSPISPPNPKRLTSVAPSPAMGIKSRC